MAARSMIRMTAAIVSLAVPAYAASNARADDLTPSAAKCSGQVSEHPFLPWLDPGAYVLVRGGTFESDSGGWRLGGVASVVTGNEPFFVHGPGEHSSLSLVSGSSATSRSVCVTLEHPTLRFFARNTGDTASTLRLQVRFKDVLGQVRTVEFGRLVGTAGWAPTPALAFIASVTAPLTWNGKIAVAFRFTPVGPAGDWRIDDAYVDPYASR